MTTLLCAQGKPFEVLCFMDTLKAMDVLKAILIDLGIPEELLHPDSLLHKDLQIDSTETVEISLALKRQLGINVKLETRQDKTLTQVCNMLEAAMFTSAKGIP
ncbi:acyl carrier protein [Halotia wernerae UHCC 0503]|nr:acyl carrier protein [Halotia wernerae UHCC 0503]